MNGSATRRRGFTMIELFGVLVLISIMVMLLLPAVQSAREAARRTSCANHLLQLSVGMQMYHAAFERLPEQLSGTDGSTQAGLDNDRRLSAFVALLPFIGQPEIVEAMSSSLTASVGSLGSFGAEDWMVGLTDSEFEFEEGQDSDSGESITWPSGGPEPFDGRYPLWGIEVSVYRCPSDPGFGIPAIARVNYAICLGDGVITSESGPMKDVAGTYVLDADLQRQTDAAMRGAMVPRVLTRYSDITDGLSHTILLGEIATDLGDRDCRTYPIAAPVPNPLDPNPLGPNPLGPNRLGPNRLRDQPQWARDSLAIDPQQPRFWAGSVTSTKLDASLGARRGFRWADGMPLYTAMNTILPPNREITLALDQDDTWGILPPSSRHQGGTHVATADGAVGFVADSIDAGDPNRPTVYLGSPTSPGSESPYGLWGAMGTRNSRELIDRKIAVE